jgi:hypothetical protein
VLGFHNLSRKNLFVALNLPFNVTVEDMKNFADKPFIQLASYPATGYSGVALVEEALREPCRITLLIFWNACNFVGATWVLVWRKVVLRLRLQELVPRRSNESGAAALPKYQTKAQYTVWLG